MSSVEKVEEAEIKLIQRWDELNIPDNLLRGIYSYGFENPSEIQKKSIPPIIDGHDVIAQAQSGMGKTGSFSIGTLSRIDTTKSKVQALNNEVNIALNEVNNNEVNEVNNVNEVNEVTNNEVSNNEVNEVNDFGDLTSSSEARNDVPMSFDVNDLDRMDNEEDAALYDADGVDIGELGEDYNDGVYYAEDADREFGYDG